MRHINLLFCIALCALLCASCKKKEDVNTETYADEAMWCCKPASCSEKADVFYIVSTNIMRSYNPDGTESMTAVLNDEEKALLAKEIDYIHQSMFPEKVNFFAPYYHQMTMNSQAMTGVTMEQLQEASAKVSQEVCDAFDYYMAHYNQGRPYVIVGYSQGANMTGKLLRHLTDDQRSHLVAAYMIGFGLNAETLAASKLTGARSATDTKVIISFNSAASVDSMYAGLLNNAVECINPVNWHTDETPANFDYDGETLTAHVDTANKLVIVDGFHYEEHETEQWDINPWSKDCYHNFEIYFYAPQIRQNVLDRIDNYIK